MEIKLSFVFEQCQIESPQRPSQRAQVRRMVNQYFEARSAGHTYPGDPLAAGAQDDNRPAVPGSARQGGKTLPSSVATSPSSSSSSNSSNSSRVSSKKKSLRVNVNNENHNQDIQNTNLTPNSRNSTPLGKSEKDMKFPGMGAVCNQE